MSEPIVSEYKLYTPNGRYVRKATMVTFPDGQKIKFLDKMTKREAIKQAKWRMVMATDPMLEDE